MLSRHAFLRACLVMLTLLCGACSTNPYRAEPIERSEPAPRSGSSTPSEGDTGSSRPVVPDAVPAPSNRHPGLEQVARTARRMTGVPYNYGGSSPRGFDCSGLVYYAYREAGFVVPRTSREQLRASRPLTLKEALPGDLVFFSTPEKVSHVGIYLGGQQFVHAPSTGKSVEIETLEQDYYRRHLIRIGRLDVLY